MTAYPLYKKYAGSDPDCANIFERVVHCSFTESRSFDVVHSEIAHGTPAIITDGPSAIDNSPPMDHVVRHRPTQTLMLVEDKNVRDWFYPEGRTDDISNMIGKAIRNKLTPMLVTRKIPYVSRLVFRRIGILAFETHHQYFHPQLKDQMYEVRHTDGIGFHDIVFSDQPNSHLTNWLDGLSPALITEYQQRFLSQEDVFRAFALERSIGLYEFLAAIGMPWHKVEEEAYEYGEFDT